MQFVSIGWWAIIRREWDTNKNPYYQRAMYEPFKYLSPKYKQLLLKVWTKYCLCAWLRCFQVKTSRNSSVFRTCYSAQHYLVVMLEKWKDAVHNKKVFEAFLTDFSKAFDYLLLDWTVAAVHACGFILPAFRFIMIFLTNRQLRFIHAHSWRKEARLIAPQGPVFRPILFDILLIHVFHIMKETEFASYVVIATYLMYGALLKM